MKQHNSNRSEDDLSTDQDIPSNYTPASPVKRTLAWIGLIYAVIFLALTTYFYFNGVMLGNLGPLLAVPGLVGLGILFLVSWKTTASPPRGVAVPLALICFALAIAAVPAGIAGLLSNFGG